MDSILSAIFLQTFYYAVVMLLGFLTVSFLLRGFFWKYIKVRMSFGRLILVKVRSTIRDYFLIGWIEEGFIVLARKREKFRISIKPEDKPFYRALAINWLDVSEDNWAICKTDYSTVSGFDTRKFSDLMTRALMRPSVTSNEEKIVMVMIIVSILISLVVAFLVWKNGQDISALKNNIPEMLANMKGTITGGGSVI